jgi:hypothetical protein
VRLRLQLPIPPMLERSPELAALAILEAALTASEAALLATYAELYNGALDGIPRGASVLRANAVIIHARRLAAALATYPPPNLLLTYALTVGPLLAACLRASRAEPRDQRGTDPRDEREPVHSSTCGRPPTSSTPTEHPRPRSG